MDPFAPHVPVPVPEIVRIDPLPSGGDAVVVTTACRSLPEDRRRSGMMPAAPAAVALRIVFAPGPVDLAGAGRHG